MYTGVEILVGVVSEKDEIETKMDTLIYNLLVFELETYGLIIEKVQFRENDSVELILTSESESGLAVICSYTNIGKRVLVDIELFDTRTMVVISSNSVSADLNLSFDKAIYTAVSELLNIADENLTKRVVNMDYGDISAESNIEEGVTKEIAEPETLNSDLGAKGGVEVFFNAGVSTGTGASRDLLRETGLSLEFSLNYWFLTSFGFFGPGLQISSNLYPSADPTGEASLLIAPMGISFAYFTPIGRLFSFLIQVGSGPALAVLVFEGEKPLSKVIPYVTGSAGLCFNIRRRMSIGLKAGYSVYFEDLELLATFTPSVYVSFRSWN